MNNNHASVVLDTKCLLAQKKNEFGDHVDPGGAFFVRLNSFAFSFRYIIKKFWPTLGRFVENSQKIIGSRKTRGAKAAFASFVCLLLQTDG